MAELLPVQQQIAALLQAGHTLTVRWDCGGDESWVYTSLNGQELDSDYGNDNDLAYLLDRYLTDLLDLPDAGDFSMKGTGRIFQDGQAVLIECESTAFADTSWMDEMSDEELADIGYTRPEPAEGANDEAEANDSYSPDPEMSNAYTGSRVLFTLP